MPLQNSNVKISARPDLATQLLQIIMPTTFDSLLCPKCQFTLQQCIRRLFIMKRYMVISPKIKTFEFFMEIFACLKRSFSGNHLSKRQGGQALAKSQLGKLCFVAKNRFRLSQGPKGTIPLHFAVGPYIFQTWDPKCYE